MATTSASVYGRYTLRGGIGSIWHELHTRTPGYDGLSARGTLYATRNTEQTLSCHITGNFNSVLQNVSGYASYNYYVGWKLAVGGSLYNASNAVDNVNVLLSGGTTIKEGSMTPGSNSSGSVDVWVDNDGSTPIYLCYYCGQTGGCSIGYAGWVVVCTLYTPTYNPYVAPSVSCSALTEISRIDDGSWSVTYNVTPPKGAEISDVGLDVIRNVGGVDRVLEIFSFGTASGNRTSNFTIHSGDYKTDGSSFNTRIYVNDNHGTSVHSSPWRLTRTYRIPTVSNVKTSRTSFSPQDNATLNWTTNSRTWTNHENNFSTKIVCGNNSVNATNQGPTNTSNDGSTFTDTCKEILNKTFLSKITSKAEQSVSVMTKNVEVHRINNLGNYNISSNTNIVVQYQPIKAPLNGTVKDSSGNSVAGQTIIIQDIPTIDLDWTYPITSGAAVVVDGYMIRIYKDSNYSQQVGNAKIVNVTQNVSSGTCELNTKSDLSRGVMNYVKITPFYTKPNGTGRIEGTQSLQMRLVLPISRINTPVISYPVNNSNWHNKNFRILLQLPSDDDIDVLGLTDSEYRYQDIDVKITPNNNSSNAITYTYKNNPEIFSTETISHTKKIAINPSLVTSFPDVATYKIEIRVQKNYYVTTGSKSYSKWSSAVVIKNTPVNTLNLTSGQIIEDDHYKYVRDASVRLHDTYPISALNKNNIAQTNGDQIDFKEYDAISSDIVLIRQNVNNYCTYNTSRVTVRFQNNISTIKGKREIITAKKEDAELSGRNYLNILIDDMNLLV